MLRSDDQTFEALLERFTPMLIAYLSGRTRNAGEAEDIIQDVFLAALGQRGRLRDPDRLGVWLLAITRNKLNTLYRRRSLEYRFREDRVDSRSADGDFFVKVADPAQRPDQKAQANEIAEAIAETISRLNDKYRLVLSLSL